MAGVGAGAGLALGAGMLEIPLGWLLLLTLTGAVGALARGWKPGLRSAEWITIHLGWKRFLQIAGLLSGAALGLWLTKSVIWLICPSLLALAGGAYFGRLAGRKLWDAGMYWDWERIWAGASAAAAAVAGALVLRWLGAGLLELNVQGQALAELVKGLAPWVEAETGNLALGWLATGALAGAVGGAVSGFVTDLVARVFGLAQ
jgi:hypothetical protein